jgi:hypothetical protein
MMTPRQKLGLTLIVVSLVTAALVQFAAGALFQIVRVEKSAVDHPFGDPRLTFQTTMIDVKCDWRYVLPIAACAALGAICLLDPQRSRA